MHVFIVLSSYFNALVITVWSVLVGFSPPTPSSLPSCHIIHSKWFTQMRLMSFLFAVIYNLLLILLINFHSFKKTVRFVSQKVSSLKLWFCYTPNVQKRLLIIK